MTVIAHGKAAHAGNNHKDGANAIWALSKFVDAAQQLTDYARGRTVNVGQFAAARRRTPCPSAPRPSSTCATRRSPMPRRSSRRCARPRRPRRFPACASRSSAASTGCRSSAPTASAALRDEYAACARASGLGDGEAPLLGGGSDANTVAPLGVPAIDGLGPRGAGFHTTTEYVELDTFVPKCEALVRFLSAACRASALEAAASRGTMRHAEHRRDRRRHVHPRVSPSATARCAHAMLEACWATDGRLVVAEPRDPRARCARRNSWRQFRADPSLLGIRVIERDRDRPHDLPDPLRRPTSTTARAPSHSTPARSTPTAGSS